MAKGQIFYSENVKNSFNNYCLAEGIEEVIVICDVNTEKHCLTLFDDFRNIIVIPSGEINKDIDTYSFIIKNLIYLKANKSSLIVNLGGGVVSDIGGFAGSTYMRGIRFLNIPTTLLAMVDASIGGKTGVDFLLHKNYLGTFALPEMILIDPVFLKTLPKEELKSGIAEMIKTGVIANAELFEALNNGTEVEKLIHLTAQTKWEITERDLLDKHERQLLNFGHTIGHAFESYRLNIDQPIRHGLAIAKGMMAETRIAYALNMINENELNLIINCIAKRTEQTELSTEDIQAIAPLLKMDKKNLKEEINFSLPLGVGSGKVKVAVDLKQIQKILLNA
ncbi:MAG: 3-dehydroquinate synthase [bacterium]|nr:3-dehydroquinate synthase [bacterium]